MGHGLVPGLGFSCSGARWILGIVPMTPRDDDHHNDKERAAEAERHLEQLKKSAHNEALERILKDGTREERLGE
jgi:hypothetical protein